MVVLNVLENKDRPVDADCIRSLHLFTESQTDLILLPADTRFDLLIHSIWRHFSAPQFLSFHPQFCCLVLFPCCKYGFSAPILWRRQLQARPLWTVDGCRPTSVLLVHPSSELMAHLDIFQFWRKEKKEKRRRKEKEKKKKHHSPTAVGSWSVFVYCPQWCLSLCSFFKTAWAAHIGTTVCFEIFAWKRSYSCSVTT